MPRKIKPTKVPVPKAAIPKPKIICIKCNSTKVRTLMSSPYNKGYHRRHKCVDCGQAFYSLSPYDMGPAETDPLPFEDEMISPQEEEYRYHLWKEAEAMYNVTFEVPLWQRISAWLRKDERDLTPTEVEILKFYRALEKRAKDMENASPIE